MDLGGFSSVAARACDVDQATLGMSFVLKRAYTGHIHDDPKKPDEPSGHAMTAASHLLCLQQGQARYSAQRASSASPPAQGNYRWTRNFKHFPASTTATSSSASPGSSWPWPLLLAATIDGSTQPGIILERLLVLAPEIAPPPSSRSISEGDESIGTTPIQAWDKILKRPVLGSLDLRCIMGLAEKLRNAAQCQEFGAVIDHAVFQQLLVKSMTAKISFTTP
ncbi:AP-1-like transcription factor [Microdochium nivale]|nr:AP-1-like transcription factor [Microdochium nivale]